MKTVNIYTDGACKGNPGAGGWSAILEYEGREKELCGGEKITTNNRMELTAAIEGLKALKTPCKVNLYSDSQYLVNAINKGWLDSWKQKGWKKADKSQVLNDDLWKILDDLLSTHEVEFIWVRGHDGHAYNERCDELASNYAESLNET
ncbi:MAG: ribonuclease HI [Clostridia bacterium]|nr:ribonuclease HI [Clostridia bacterium]